MLILALGNCGVKEVCGWNSGGLTGIHCMYVHPHTYMQTYLPLVYVHPSCTCKQAFLICTHVHIGGLCGQVAFLYVWVGEIRLFMVAQELPSFLYLHRSNHEPLPNYMYIYIMYICIYVHILDDSGNLDKLSL